AGNVKAVFLFGHVPVPYSVDFAADFHGPAHQVAWPAVVFYGDMNGTWTDYAVNDSGAESSRNWNVPGDGKFDQSYAPSAVGLEVGRVDLSDLRAFSLGEKELLRQYLNKDHNYRHRLITLPRRGLIHDSGGVRDGESLRGQRLAEFRAVVRFGQYHGRAGRAMAAHTGQSGLSLGLWQRRCQLCQHRG